MQESQINVLLFAGLLLILWVTGFLLKKQGGPYSVFMVTLHKLGSLAFLLLIGISIYKGSNIGTPRPLDWLFLIAGTITAVGALATGGVMTSKKITPHTTIKRIHTLCWILFLGFTGYLYFWVM